MAQARRKPKHVCQPPEGWIDPTNVETKYLAEVLGITATQVSNLKKQGIIKGNGRRARYNLVDCIPLYFQSIRSSGTAEAAQLLKVAQRRKLELANDKAAGLLVHISDVAAVLNAAAAGFLSTWKSIPRRVAAELAVAKSAKRCREILEAESDNARHELATPIRKFYADSGQDLPDILADTVDGRETPTPKPRRVGKRKPNTAKRKR